MDFLEVHAENCMSAGGPALHHMERLWARWPLSVQGLGLSIGADGPLYLLHLDRLAAVVERFEPRWVSEHLACGDTTREGERAGELNLRSRRG